MDLKQYCHSITHDELFSIATKVCTAALPIWNEYSTHGELIYRDTVVGLSHKVNAGLLEDSVTFCKGETFERAAIKPVLNLLLKEFSDPIVALQDLDWELPYPAEHIFYAVYNLLDGLRNRVNYQGELIHYISINQAADALTESGLMSFDEIKAIIYPNTQSSTAQY